MHPITYGPSDPTLPLTVIEWEEWGDPLTDPAALANMLSYSPVDNVASQRYPHLLLTAGLHDPRVAFWEPAKFVAKASAGEGGRMRQGRMHCHSRRPRCDALPTSQALLRPATAHCLRVFAQVRDLNPNSSSLVLLRTTMTGGHFSQSSLAVQLRETAFKFAFLLQTVAPCHAGQAGSSASTPDGFMSCPRPPVPSRSPGAAWRAALPRRCHCHAQCC